MSTKLEPIRIELYPSATSRRTISRLPQTVDMERLIRDFNGAETAGILPYFEQGNWELNATTATVVRQALRGHRVLAPIPAKSVKEARNYIQTFSAGGFDAFCLPELIGGVPVQNKAGFWMMNGILHQHQWFHLCGGKGVDIPADVPGRWTWSEEEM